ncbi:hypothetical protein KL918_005132 [Ogataea parapolymorpha]|uniref:Topoisomerase I damage affected protein 11 n=1 Tax=Ogataea parapolymorpha (strain ATCC 26012 / BCRC 20466 / JCM 22074 / NRRL Y-7560 / DL-1) TaxID=871575 RepID=W1QCZ2_OGAPD|nr:hypothetical protein HPODL_04036 [Ogataea parapolymorpha DL-1]ESW98409.1 hypothetical protein HPODL_04036 [Ogataea parapolymorpha DL-1]KAG7864811.1 hypothetical protein KL918_005132 [Ogataea parapolymorpha]KAG7873315.1 hypothetical protein KL916_002264 [Ogataea parapolymorpha]
MSMNRSFKVSNQSLNTKVVSTVHTKVTPNNDVIEEQKEQIIGTNSASPYLGEDADGSLQSNKRTGINLGLTVYGTELPETEICSRASSSMQETLNQDPILPNMAKNSSLNSPSITPTRHSESDQQDHGLSHDLRLLASKEMEILEINQQMKALSHRKKDLEIEIQELKIGIEKALTTNFGSGQPQRSNHGIFEKHVPKSPNSLQRRRLQTTGVFGDPLLNSNSSDKVDDDLRDDFGRSWFAKPLTLFQQIDSLIYQEFEKLHIGPAFMNSSLPGSERKSDHLDNSEGLLCSSSFDEGNQEKDTSLQKGTEKCQNDQEFHNSSDIVQSVSSKLWNFVNEVKHNLAVDEESETSTPSSSPKKPRTPSFSKRRSYGLHGKQTRRSSNLDDKSRGTKVDGLECSDSSVLKSKDTEGVELRNQK